MTPQSIGAAARAALDSAGQEAVTLKDLRYDFIFRQLRDHDWPYVLKISGLTVETYRTHLSPMFTEQTAPSAEEPSRSRAKNPENEYRLWRIMQTGKDTPAGIALWLMQQMGLQIEQIVRLIWDDVDFAKNAIRLPGGAVPMTRGVSRVLAEEKARRGPEDDPHVTLTPTTRKPIEPDRMSVMLRTALIRGGIDDLSPVDIRRGAVRDFENKQILSFVGENGFITTKQAAALLEMTDGRARHRLKMMVDGGQLVCVGIKYYPAERIVSPEKHRELIMDYIESEGSIRCQTAAHLLNLPPRQAGLVLKHMVERNFIVRVGNTRRYVSSGKA